MSRRTERVGSLIREVIAEAIQTQLNDPRIEPLTSITRVDVSQDLAHARIHVSIFAPPARQQLCLHALRRAAGRLRRLLGPNLQTRTLPQLDFVLDETIQRTFETVRLIEKTMEEHAPPTDGTTAPEDEKGIDQ